MSMSREEWEWEARMIDMENATLDRQYLEEMQREQSRQADREQAREHDRWCDEQMGRGLDGEGI